MENTFKKKVIIVSNREPYTMKKGRLSKTVGGLVSALDPLMRSNNGVWISTGSASDVEKSGARALSAAGRRSVLHEARGHKPRRRRRLL